jgi:hypothetical protein
MLSVRSCGPPSTAACSAARPPPRPGPPSRRFLRCGGGAAGERGPGNCAGRAAGRLRRGPAGRARLVGGAAAGRPHGPGRPTRRPGSPGSSAAGWPRPRCRSPRRRSWPTACRAPTCTPGASRRSPAAGRTPGTTSRWARRCWPPAGHHDRRDGPARRDPAAGAVNAPRQNEVAPPGFGPAHRRRAGATDRFPGVDVMSQARHWDHVTAELVTPRLAAPPPLAFFHPAEQTVRGPSSSCSRARNSRARKTSPASPSWRWSTPGWRPRRPTADATRTCPRTARHRPGLARHPGLSGRRRQAALRDHVHRRAAHGPDGPDPGRTGPEIRRLARAERRARVEPVDLVRLHGAERPRTRLGRDRLPRPGLPARLQQRRRGQARAVRDPGRAPPASAANHPFPGPSADKHLRASAAPQP